MKSLSAIMMAVALGAAALVAGCGGDDSEATNNGNPDAAADVVTPETDGGPTFADTGAPDTSTTACNFATFVKGLIASDTTATALPSTDLGQNCVDNQNQAEFSSLFP